MIECSNNPVQHFFWHGRQTEQQKQLSREQMKHSIVKKLVRYSWSWLSSTLIASLLLLLAVLSLIQAAKKKELDLAARREKDHGQILLGVFQCFSHRMP